MRRRIRKKNGDWCQTKGVYGLLAMPLCKGIDTFYMPPQKAMFEGWMTLHAPT